MNDYFKNLNKIEFAVTMSCTGKCKHCQNGDPDNNSEHLDSSFANEMIKQVCKYYKISTVMTFGGESLLYPDTVCDIHKTAKELGVSKRQIITNGYFSKNNVTIDEVAHKLALSYVNDLLLSVDAFHQETIPIAPVKYFAECALKYGLPIKLQPAWLVSQDDNNPYNLKTKEILHMFDYLNIPEGSGNVIFPSGNALKYLKGYFDDSTLSSPYEEVPYDIKTLSVEPNGNVLNGNIYKTDIIEIMNKYYP